MDIGQKFNKLTLLSIVQNDKHPFIGQFICECGKQKQINIDNVKRGLTKSCGCYRKESALNRKHDLSQSKEYRSWAHMKDRCYSKNCKDYENYGARGITVCDRWLNSFEAFYEDMGEKPEESYSLERIDVNGNYTPENCKWASKSEQNYNKRKHKNNTSGRTGVSFNKNESLWVARIHVRGEALFLGYFVTIDEAIKARELAELKYFGKVKK